MRRPTKRHHNWSSMSLPYYCRALAMCLPCSCHVLLCVFANVVKRLHMYMYVMFAWSAHFSLTLHTARFPPLPLSAFFSFLLEFVHVALRQLKIVKLEYSRRERSGLKATRPISSKLKGQNHVGRNPRWKRNLCFPPKITGMNDWWNETGSGMNHRWFRPSPHTSQGPRSPSWSNPGEKAAHTVLTFQLWADGPWWLRGQTCREMSIQVWQ